MTSVDSSYPFQRLRSNLERVRDEIRRAADRVGRDPDSVTLVGVTKYVEPEVIRGLWEAGLRDFGESTVQRLLENAKALADVAGIRWTIIGHLQRNKVPLALRLAYGIHSIDSERLLREIGLQAVKRGLEVPNLYIEVNIGDESQKTGLPVKDLRSLLTLAREPGIFPMSQDGRPLLTIAGFMGMAPYSREPEDSRPHFRRLRTLKDEFEALGLLPADAGLSMGMSGDFAVAVEEGATVVRVGSALFEGVIS